jgi:hypothetical protein
MTLPNLSYLSDEERITITCSLCGASFSELPGLKRHKSRLNHWLTKPKKIRAFTAKPIQFDKLVEKEDQPVSQYEFQPTEEEVEQYDQNLEEIYKEPIVEVEKPEFVIQKEEPKPIIEEFPTIEEPEYLNPVLLGYDHIPVGSLVRLSNKATCFKKVGSNYLPGFDAAQVQCIVKMSTETQQGVFLHALTEYGDQWSFLEDDALSGKVKVLALGESDAPSSVDLIERQEFVRNCQVYAEARDAKNDSAKSYESVDEEIRPVIVKYLQKYGQESAEGKGDSRVDLGGFSVVYTYTPGKLIIRRNEEKIVKYCLENGLSMALKSALNVEVWESMVKSGIIPAEFLREVEIPVQQQEVRKLYVKKID